MLFFSWISDLRINIHKSALIGVGLDLEEVHSIASFLGCHIGSLLRKYMGLQIGGKRWDV